MVNPFHDHSIIQQIELSLEGKKKYIPGLRNNDIVEWRMARAESRKSNLYNHYVFVPSELTVVLRVIAAA